MVGVRLKHDSELNLALEVVDLSSVLGLGEGELMAGDVLDDVAVLFEDVFAFSGLAKVVVPEMSTTDVCRDAVVEACVLGPVSKVHDMRKSWTLTSFIWCCTLNISCS